MPRRVGSIAGHDARRGFQRCDPGSQPAVSALASAFRDVRKGHGVTTHASVNLERVADELDPVGGLALYRIVQLGVANAVRRARVSEGPHEAQIDGRGAEAVGGSLTVEISPGKGTTVRAAVPMVNPDGERW